MSNNLTRAIGGAAFAVLAAGAVALTAVAPASATTVQAAPVKTAAQGDRVQGPAVFQYTPQGQATGQWYNFYKTTTINGNAVPYGESKVATTPTFTNPTETWSFATPGTWGPIMNSQGQCLEAVGGGVIRFTACTGNADQEFKVEPAGTSIGTLAPGQILTRSNAVVNTIAAAGDRSMGLTGYTSQTIALDLSGLTPVDPPACTAGLTGVVNDVDQAAKSAVVGGTGKAGETITVSGAPGGAVTTVVGADGKWTAGVPGLATGNNALTVSSSDNCAPVSLSVIIDVLEIPVAHPLAAASAGVLGLGALLVGGLRRRTNAKA